MDSEAPGRLIAQVVRDEAKRARIGQFRRDLVIMLVVAAVCLVIGYRVGREDGFELGLFKTAENVMGQK